MDILNFVRKNAKNNFVDLYKVSKKLESILCDELPESQILVINRFEYVDGKICEKMITGKIPSDKITLNHTPNAVGIFANYIKRNNLMKWEITVPKKSISVHGNISENLESKKDDVYVDRDTRDLANVIKIDSGIYVTDFSKAIERRENDECYQILLNKLVR